MARKLENIRNIGIIAHIDAGKTTVTERMLFYSGSKHRAGGVDKGTTETDNDPEEQDRGITIYSACVTFDWKRYVVNLLDTPGHVDFTAEVERCLRVLDGGVVVFSAREGVEAQSETVWQQADKYRVPRMIFINKMDREGADFEGTIEQIGERLETANPVPIQIPVGQGPAHAPDPFRGVIDLIRMKMLSFTEESDGKEIAEADIPAELVDDAQMWREQMLESLYNYSNELMELALEESEIPAKLIHKVLRDATLHQQIQVLMCGSALHGMGVQPVLDAVGEYLPSPADRPPVVGLDVKKKGEVEIQRKPDPNEPFCGLVFKILPAKTGDLYWLRIYSGTLKGNSRVINSGKGKKENVSQLWHIHATKKESQEESVSAGDIVGVVGPRLSITGDTLCDPKEPILLEAIQFPETVISMAIEPESTDDRKKLSETLEMMKRQDPTFSATENEDTGQTIISGMGELHLEVIEHRLLRDFNLNVKVHKPRVSYRETIASEIEITGNCNRQIGGQQLTASVKLRMAPAPEDQEQPVEVIDKSAGSLPAGVIDAVMEELRSRSVGGGLINGFPLMKLQVTVLGGKHPEDDIQETAFVIAAGEAFERGLREGGPVLLEPVMRLTITTPEDYLGEFVGDLQQRRATIHKTENRGKSVAVEAHAPMAELFGYTNSERSLSQGRANHSMEPLGYFAAPPEVVSGFGL